LDKLITYLMILFSQSWCWWRGGNTNICVFYCISLCQVSAAYIWT